MSLLSGAAAATGVVAQHCCFFSKNEKRNGTCRLAEFGVWKNEKTKNRRIHLFLNCYMSFFNTCSWVSLTWNILAAKVVEPEGRLK